MKSQVDIVIVGGGPVGAALALALRDSGLSVLLLEAHATPGDDPRTLALSYGTRLILERLGAWGPALPATPIETIHVSQRGGFGRTLLRAADVRVPALGYVVRYADLTAALYQGLPVGGAIEALTGAQVQQVAATAGYAAVQFVHGHRSHDVTCRLLVLADGGRSLRTADGLRLLERDYRQSALVAQVSSELPHNNVAYERFTETGPAALLPHATGFALVWTATPAEAQRLCALDEAQFVERLHQHFGDRVGRFVAAGPRAQFPLLLRVARSIKQKRTVLLGNAAHTLHPVAGQGFNLGMRGAFSLAAILHDTPPEQVGSAAMLARFASARRWDVDCAAGATDLLVRTFSNANPLLKLGRGIGLALLDTAPPVRNGLARGMMFGTRGL